MKRKLKQAKAYIIGNAAFFVAGTVACETGRRVLA
jgi:hypothetical protein